MHKTAQILRNRPGCISCLQSATFRCQTTKCAPDVQISIPHRIHRGPTDILRALQSTIKRDNNAAHYKYHDDPYLIPASNLNKRTFALAQESGRKTAHWVREQHPNLFQHRDCMPHIEAFFPKMVYNEKSAVSAKDLQSAVENAFVSDAIVVYKLLKERNIEIDAETTQSLLEMLCFCNHEDMLKEDFIEERWYIQGGSIERTHKTWKDGQLAEELFFALPERSAAAYSAIVQGMAKFYQIDRAWQLFQEGQAKGLLLNVEAYNSIIRVSGFLKEGFELRWTFVIDMLSSMNTAKIAPNLRTLNAVLEALSGMGTFRQSRQNALKTIREFKQIGIEPSLASWHFLLLIFCRDHGPKSFILKDILPFIENRELQIQDNKDTSFFTTAMEVCRNHLHNAQLAERVNNLLHFGNNYDLIGDSYKESIYYKNYFLVMMGAMPLDEFMSQIYEELVPHVYVPEFIVIDYILNQIGLNEAPQFLPKIWSDMIIFDHAEHEKLLVKLLSVMMENKPAEGSQLLCDFVTIAWGVWEKAVNQKENRIRKISLTGEMLGQIMTIALWNKDIEKATTVMDKLQVDVHNVAGVPKIESLSMYIDACIAEKLASNAIECLQYCADCGFTEAELLAQKLHKHLTLADDDLATVAKIVGEHVLPVKSQDSDDIVSRKANRKRN